MTNRSKSAKKPRLRFLDLSFEDRDEGKRNSPENGRRPHGGIRGSKKHPPTPFAQEKPRDYHRKLREDIDRLFEEEFLEIHGTPSWTIEASKEITHSGESPLFLHKFMSPTKNDNQFVRHSRSAVTNPNKCHPPLSRDGVTYYRPNRTHQYLTATELKDQSQNEVNLKYGRPTRTTLLRARQRTNSAPVNSYEIRRENMKREEELRNSSIYTNPKEFLQEVHGTNGETFHSFITGARYNRAHCIDAKSLTLYGVYMPRDNPTACFVTGPNKLKDVFETPSAPPDSPRSDVDDGSTPMVPRRPTTAPGYGRRPTPVIATHPKHAWGDGENNDKNGDGRVYEELIFWPTGLSVKGRSLGVNLKRTNSMPRLDAKLPSVHGVSMERKSRDPVEETSLINQPPPSPMATSGKDDPADKTANSPPETAKPDGSKKESVQKKPKPILVDRSVNVPSVSGDSNNMNEETFMKISACAVPQAKSTSESGSVKVVNFQKDDDTKKGGESQQILPNRDQESGNNEKSASRKEEEETEAVTIETKEADIEVPSLTSVEVRVASPIQTSDRLPATPEVTFDNLSNQSQGTEPMLEITENDNSKTVDENPAFFITEKDGDKHVSNINKENDLTLEGEGQKMTPRKGHSDQMVIPQVTIEEASVSGESDGVGDVEQVENIEENTSYNSQKGDNSGNKEEDDMQKTT